MGIKQVMDKLHYEDLEIGRSILTPSRVVTDEALQRFRAGFDPQCPPTDAPRTPPATLAPMHMCGVLMQSLALDFLNQAASLGSPGIDEVCFHDLARVGEPLHVRIVCLHKRALASRPSVGLAKMAYELLDSRQGVLLRWEGNQFMRIRAPRAAATPAAESAPPRESGVSPWSEAGAPLMTDLPLWWEDYAPGLRVTLGSHLFERAEVLAYAAEFDPQPFHLNEAAARESLFGALSASGWHTATIAFGCLARCWQDSLRVADPDQALGSGLAPLPSARLADLRWTKPVHPGDRIEYRLLVETPAAASEATAEDRHWLALHDCHGLRPVPVILAARNQHEQPLFQVRFALWLPARALS
ncbi:MAG: hypothetical protein KDK91_29830 [Gammaproteobacteria bacterium]|nr:hypothetical protein [Gammaproteobacteria bacterium]